jgi:CubicO group peptidase (beta-lactamase class C family)
MATRIPFLIFVFFLAMGILPAQDPYYFPPLDGSDWATQEPSELGWCDEKLDSLQSFLEENNSRSFILLHQGKIVLEYYFDGADASSFWYLASAGKSITGFLTGMAQEEGLLDINEPTSTYLGEGWTIAPSEKEDLITIWHQITMTSGLDDMIEVPGVPDPANCLEPECLDYLQDAGTRWAYHNAPYRLMLDVLANASGQTINQFTNERLNDRIGTDLFWLAYVCWGRARDAARFGLLTLNNGIWASDTLLADQEYFQAMVNTSQEHNRAYGYLWWLNGKESYMVPGIQLVFPGSLVPDAPDDLIAALGLNDQKIYVVPSLDLVVVRQGDAAGEVLAGPSSFDNQLWLRLMDLGCTTSTTTFEGSDWQLWPLPAREVVEIQAPSPEEEATVMLFDLNGQQLTSKSFRGKTALSVATLPRGIYLLKVRTEEGSFTRKWVVQ